MTLTKVIVGVPQIQIRSISIVGWAEDRCPLRVARVDTTSYTGVRDTCILQSLIPLTVLSGWGAPILSTFNIKPQLVGPGWVAGVLEIGDQRLNLGCSTFGARRAREHVDVTWNNPCSLSIVEASADSAIYTALFCEASRDYPFVAVAFQTSCCCHWHWRWNINTKPRQIILQIHKVGCIHS